MPLNDLWNRLAADATPFLMENREKLAWVMVVAQYAAPLLLDEHALNQDFGGGEGQVIEAAIATMDQFDVPLEPTSTVIGGPELEAEINQTSPAPTAPENPAPENPAPENPAPPTSTEIGGPHVDAQIDEIKNLQAEHEKALSALNGERVQAVQTQALGDDKLAQSYFAGHPDQTPEERSRDQQKFEGAKELNRQDVEAKYDARTNDLKATQAVEMATLQAKITPEAPLPPAPPSPPPPDLNRSL